MAYAVERVSVWKGVLPDKPGTLAKVLDPLNGAGANLEFLFAREFEAGTSLTFMAPIKGSAQAKAARAAGLSEYESPSLRIMGPDRPGLGKKIAATLGENGINIRGLAAMGIGKQTMFYIALAKADVGKAQRALKKAL